MSVTLTANLTNVTSMTGIEDMGQFASTATNHLFWELILVALFIIILVRLMNWGFDKAIISGSFICLLIGIVLFNLSWITLLQPVIYAVLIAVGGIYLYLS